MPPHTPPATLVLQPAALGPRLAAAWLVLMSLTVLAYVGNAGRVQPVLIGLFNVEADRSVLHVYQGGLLLVLFGLAALAARRGGALGVTGPRWTVAAGVCLLLALQQFMNINVFAERRLAAALADYTRLVLALPIGLALGGLCLALAPGLPAGLRGAVLWSAGVYAAGAVGVHGLSGLLGVAPTALVLAAQVLQTGALTFLLARLLALAGEAGAVLHFDVSAAKVRPGAVVRGLAGLALALVALSTLVLLVALAQPAWLPPGLVRRVSLDQENSLPTAFSGCILFLAALLLVGLAALKQRAGHSGRHYWTLLAGLFIYMTVDELASVHEQFNPLGLRLLDRAQPLFYAWVVPMLVVVLLVVVLFARFVFHLPPRTRWLFVLAGGCYVGGAVGLEIIGGLIVGQTSMSSLGYIIAMTLEESFEITGVLLFIYALLDYVGRGWADVSVAFAPALGSRAARPAAQTVAVE